MSPSACNSQPWKFVVVDDKNKLAEMAEAAEGLGMNKFTHNVPVMVAVVLEKMNAFDDYLRDYLVRHKDSVRTEDITSVVIGYDPKIKPTAQNKYKPANTKVLKPPKRNIITSFANHGIMTQIKCI